MPLADDRRTEDEAGADGRAHHEGLPPLQQGTFPQPLIGSTRRARQRKGGLRSGRAIQPGASGESTPVAGGVLKRRLAESLFVWSGPRGGATRERAPLGIAGRGRDKSVRT